MTWDLSFVVVTSSFRLHACLCVHEGLLHVNLERLAFVHGTSIASVIEIKLQHC